MKPARKMIDGRLRLLATRDSAIIILSILNSITTARDGRVQSEEAHTSEEKEMSVECRQKTSRPEAALYRFLGQNGIIRCFTHANITQ